MRGDATRLALALFVLVVACAVEEAVPKADWDAGKRSVK